MADRFRELLKTRDYIIFDGAMGTMLQAAGMKMGETPEVLNITRPELLVSIAGQYYNAGSDVVYANTFGANRYKLEECGKSVEELVTAGIVNAKKARDTVKPDGLVALDVGPIGQLLEPTGVLSFEEAYDMYAEIVKAGAAAGAAGAEAGGVCGHRHGAGGPGPGQHPPAGAVFARTEPAGRGVSVPADRGKI